MCCWRQPDVVGRPLSGVLFCVEGRLWLGKLCKPTDVVQLVVGLFVDETERVAESFDLLDIAPSAGKIVHHAASAPTASAC